MKTNIHPNSLNAWNTEGKELSNRELEIVSFMHKTQILFFTDRELAAAMGFSHRSAVQPRVSELIKKQILKEAGKTRCEETGKTVRFVSLANVSLEPRHPIPEIPQPPIPTTLRTAEQQLSLIR